LEKRLTAIKGWGQVGMVDTSCRFIGTVTLIDHLKVLNSRSVQSGNQWVISMYYIVLYLYCPC